jgi:hypothetical protein
MLRTVVTSAKVPTEDDLLHGDFPKLILTDSAGKPAWIVDLNGSLEGTLQAEICRSFRGASVSWTSRITSVSEPRKDGATPIAIEFPIPKRVPPLLPPGIKFASAEMVIPATKMPKGSDPSVGDYITFSARLAKEGGDNKTEAVWVRYGVGPNARRAELGLTLTAVDGVRIQPPVTIAWKTPVNRALKISEVPDITYRRVKESRVDMVGFIIKHKAVVKVGAEQRVDEATHNYGWALLDRDTGTIERTNLQSRLSLALSGPISNLAGERDVFHKAVKGTAEVKVAVYDYRGTPNHIVSNWLTILIDFSSER